MAEWVWILIVVAAVLAAIPLFLLGFASARRWRRSARLRQRFGPEYERIVEQEGRERGEHELEARIRRHDGLTLRPLSPAANRAKWQAWTLIQAGFVDAPVTAVRDADQLVFDTLRELGYPLETVDQRAAALSVDHAGLAARYRDACQALGDAQTGSGDVARLHTALLAYRGLLGALLEPTEPSESATSDDAAALVGSPTTSP